MNSEEIKSLTQTPEHLLKKVADEAQEQKLKVYAVGGYLRDRLLGLPFSGEIDLSVVGDASDFASSLKERWGLRSKIHIYKNFGTAKLQVGDIRLEFATSRRESYREDSRNPLVEPAPFDEDLARRDFTINALAIDVTRPDELIDHYNGVEDLQNKLLRTPLNPEQTFSDDPLRMMRAVRFAARLGFSLVDEMVTAINKMKGRLKIVARERVNEEFFKILAVTPPSRGLQLLFDTGLLKEFFPELVDLAGVEQRGRHHHKDVWQHTLKVLDNLSEKTDKVSLRFAALVHDIGKPRTKAFVKGKGWTFHAHEYVGERMMRKITRRNLLPETMGTDAASLIRLHMRPMSLQDEGVTDSAIRRLVVQAGDLIDDLLILCRADITSGNEKKVRRYLAGFDRMVERMQEIEEKDEFRNFQSPIRGEEIMERTGYSEGPKVGLVKALIEEAILEGEIPFSREGAESIFEEIVVGVNRLSSGEVIRQLKAVKQSRSEGKAPPEKDC